LLAVLGSSIRNADSGFGSHLHFDEFVYSVAPGSSIAPVFLNCHVTSRKQEKPAEIPGKGCRERL
jgi:hypothetical protein